MYKKTYLCEHFETVIKDQITLNEHSINIPGRMFVRNFERTFPERSENVPC